MEIINKIKKAFKCPIYDECKYAEDCPSCTFDFNEDYCGQYREILEQEYKDKLLNKYHKGEL